MKKNIQIHLIANSHLDPVWLWDWREGLNEGISTVRTILELMDRNKELTYIRGEAAVYQYIEKYDPKTFKKIQQYVKSGRWDVVGGTYIQPDTNLSSAETISRHFTLSKRYFKSQFNKDVKVAWQADSFGHTAGLPEILASAGMESFAFSRPIEKDFHLEEPAFWWVGEAGARILSYRCPVGWYGSERDEIPRRMNALLDMALKSKIKTVGCFYGLGNHGGGPSQRHIDDIAQWIKEHPEIKVIHSGLHGFFAALRRELKQIGEGSIPSHKGELNFCLRGCYSSMAKFKYLYRRAENHLSRAEKTSSAISALTGTHAPDLEEAWKGILFNSFHDILPGSSIERAFEDQIAWVGGISHKSHEAEVNALNALACKIDTRVAPHPADMPSAVIALAWNPHPTPYKGLLEIEASLDYRPIFKYGNRANEIPLQVLDPHGHPLPFQKIENESQVCVHTPWRQRVLVPAELQSFGWNVFEFAWVEGAQNPPITHGVKSGENWIDNGIYRIEASVGEKLVHISRHGKNIFPHEGISFRVVEDPWGSWGGMQEEKESYNLSEIREEWEISHVGLMERGPLRGVLWVRFSGAKSRIDIFFSLSKDSDFMDANARLFWSERSARLKMSLPTSGDAEFEVPAATVKRSLSGEVPGGRWVKTKYFGFASDALYNFNLQDNHLDATIVRSTRYACEGNAPEDKDVWMPATDQGEHKFRFIITTQKQLLAELTQTLEQPPLVMLTHPHGGKLPRKGSVTVLSPASLHLLALKPSENGNGYVVRVHVPTNVNDEVKLIWLGQKISLGKVQGGEVVSWLLSKKKNKWEGQRVSLHEHALN